MAEDSRKFHGSPGAELRGKNVVQIACGTSTGRMFQRVSSLGLIKGCADLYSNSDP